jgi:CxxC motif-containing protein
MEKHQKIICITCPKGCRAQVWQEGETIEIKGKVCKKGKPYLRQEFIEPMRILTSTVVVENSRTKRLPVRTAGAVPKKELFHCLEEMMKVRARPPIEMGQVIISNILDTGVDVIASDDLPADS